MSEEKKMYRWKDNHPQVTPEQMKAAFEYADNPENYECNCWISGCRYRGNCKACKAFHTALKQIPTCQRELIEELYGYYIPNLPPDVKYTYKLETEQ